jgi:hypothetical protein
MARFSAAARLPLASARFHHKQAFTLFLGTPSPLASIIPKLNWASVSQDSIPRTKPAFAIELCAHSFPYEMSGQGLLPAPQNGMSDITDIYVAIYGEPPVGQKVFIG